MLPLWSKHAPPGNHASLWPSPVNVPVKTERKYVWNINVVKAFKDLFYQISSMSEILSGQL